MKKYDIILTVQGTPHQHQEFLGRFEAKQQFMLKDIPPEERPINRKEKCDEIVEVKIYRIGTENKETMLQWISNNTWWTENINFDKITEWITKLFTGYKKEIPLKEKINLPNKMPVYYVASREKQ